MDLRRGLARAGRDLPMAALPAFRPQRSALLACGAVAAAILLPWALKSRTREPLRDELFVRSEQLDFGSAIATKGFTWELELENTTDKEIEIKRFDPTCRCTKVEPAKLSIPPHERRTVRLHLDLLPQSEADLLSPERPFAVTIKPVFRDGSPRQSGWQVTGSVESPYELAPGFVNFADTLAEGQPYPVRRVEIRPRHPLEKLEARSEFALAAVTVAQDPVDSDRFVLEIQADQRLPVGPHEFDVLLMGQSGGQPLAPYPLRVRANVLPDVRVTPRSLSLGLGEVGSALEGEVLLRSFSERPFEVLTAELPAGFEVVGGLPAKPALSQTLRIRVQACQSGPQTHLLSFEVRTTLEEKPRTLQVRASYLGRQRVQESKAKIERDVAGNARAR